jgi:hypothetical protein
MERDAAVLMLALFGLIGLVLLIALCFKMEEVLRRIWTYLKTKTVVISHRLSRSKLPL